MSAYAKLGVMEYWLIDYKSTKIESYILNKNSYNLKDVYIFEADKESDDYEEHVPVTLTSFLSITVNLEEVFDFELD